MSNPVKTGIGATLGVGIGCAGIIGRHPTHRHRRRLPNRHRQHPVTVMAAKYTPTRTPRAPERRLLEWSEKSMTNP